MKHRVFPATGGDWSQIGIGTWQLGGAEWGDVPEDRALATLAAAAGAGTTFIDTADIYGMGRSESLIGRFLKSRPDRGRFFIATKLGRNPDPGWPANFEYDAIRRHTEASLERLGVDCIDLTQTHCIPHEVMKQGKVWEHLRRIRNEGLIRNFGASVESMDEALTCLEVEGMSSLQIIFNIFRRKPIDVLFEKAQQKQVAIIVRLALASGLLSGKMSRQTSFVASDHRHFNRDGQAFSVGETFAGLPYEYALGLVEKIRPLTPPTMTMAQFALRWCLDFDAVTTVIPGASRPQQARDNAAASDFSPLPQEVHRKLKELYDQHVVGHIRGGY